MKENPPVKEDYWDNLPEAWKFNFTTFGQFGGSVRSNANFQIAGFVFTEKSAERFYKQDWPEPKDWALSVVERFSNPLYVYVYSYGNSTEHFDPTNFSFSQYRDSTEYSLTPDRITGFESDEEAMSGFLEVPAEIIDVKEGFYIHYRYDGAEVSVSGYFTESPYSGKRSSQETSGDKEKSEIKTGGSSDRLGSLKWSYEIKDNVNMLDCLAVGKNGIVYVGTFSSESDVSSIYAINSDGELKWRYEIDGYLYNSPAIGDDGTIYVGSTDDYLYALNSNGDLKWRYKTGGDVRTSPAIGVDGTIYVGSDDQHLYALSPEGNLKWRYETGRKVRSDPAIGDSGTIYVGSEDQHLYALSPEGNLKWRYSFSGLAYSIGFAIGDDGTIYVVSTDDYLYALNSNGDLKWRYKTGGSMFAPLAIGNSGTIYVGSSVESVEYLYAINSDGELKWRHELEESVSCSPAIGEDGSIYVKTWDTYLYVLSPDGEVRWGYDTGDFGKIDTPPAIREDGTIYVGGATYKASYLYAINSDSYGLANSTWPMFGKNLKHTSRVATGRSSEGKEKEDTRYSSEDKTKVTIHAGGNLDRVTIAAESPGGVSITEEITGISGKANSQIKVFSAEGPPSLCKCSGFVKFEVGKLVVEGNPLDPLIDGLSGEEVDKLWDALDNPVKRNLELSDALCTYNEGGLEFSKGLIDLSISSEYNSMQISITKGGVTRTYLYKGEVTVLEE